MEIIWFGHALAPKVTAIFMLCAVIGAVVLISGIWWCLYESRNDGSWSGKVTKVLVATPKWVYAVVAIVGTYVYVLQSGVPFPGRFVTHSERNGMVLIKSDAWTGDNWVSRPFATENGWRKVQAGSPSTQSN